MSMTFKVEEAREHGESLNIVNSWPIVAVISVFGDQASVYKMNFSSNLLVRSDLS